MQRLYRGQSQPFQNYPANAVGHLLPFQPSVLWIVLPPTIYIKKPTIICLVVKDILSHPPWHLTFLKNQQHWEIQKQKVCLVLCTNFGMGVETDFILSEKHYLTAAKKEDGLAMARLAFLRKYGRPNVKIDRAEAEEWSEKIRNDPSAIQWIFEAATINHHPATQYALGVCYHDGISVPKNEHAAYRWYKASADQGHARGQGILGYCYSEGYGCEKDQQEAMRWYHLAAAQGETVAIYNIGYCKEEGVGCEKDVTEAVKWYTLAAEQGNAFAQNSIGYCKEDGIGCEQDFEEAAYWYKLSAEQGYPWAQCNYGYLKQNGIGVEKDDAQGFYWYSQAARQGHARAQHNIGYCFQK